MLERRLDIDVSYVALPTLHCQSTPASVCCSPAANSSSNAASRQSLGGMIDADTMAESLGQARHCCAVRAASRCATDGGNDSSSKQTLHAA